MIRKRKTVVAKRVTPKVMTGIPKSFGILNDPLGNQIEAKLMSKEEVEQRRWDRFWGQDKDQHDREVERKLMAEEDLNSMSYEKWHETLSIHKKWDEEYQRNIWFESRSEAKYKEIERREYMKFVKSSLSSEEVISFVWGANTDMAHASQQESQGLVFSDLSAIGKEVALSLPSTVGALHMSIHMDGLQQSRAIIDEASTAFKQTLRRINTQSADDGDAAQPFKTNALAADLIRSTKKKKKNGSSLAATDSEAQRPITQPAVPVHVPAIDGHRLHKWDQTLMLQLAFMSLDQGGKGFLTGEEVANVSHDAAVHSLLSFTVFWANIKKRNWAFFQVMGGLSGTSFAVQDGLAGVRVSMQDWMYSAQAQSFETAVPLRHIRTQEEHEQLCAPAKAGAAAGAALDCNRRGAGAANVFGALAEREHRVSRVLAEGDCVWALHNSGVVWLPAVVKAVHFGRANPVATLSAHRNTVAYSSHSYDLWYPLSQKELNKARSTMEARQLLALPSQQQAQRALQERLLQLSLASGSAADGVGPVNSLDSLASASQCLPPRPLADERMVCAYAFDLVDSGGEGIVPLRRLVQCLQSLEFSRVVATSLALSMVFHGGSAAVLHGAAATPSGDSHTSRSAPLAGGAADIPSLLPVFIDTFSAPAAGGVGERPGQGAEGAAAQDWISKLDFLEFCQAAVDIKRYSAMTASQQQ